MNTNPTVVPIELYRQLQERAHELERQLAEKTEHCQSLDESNDELLETREEAEAECNRRATQITFQKEKISTLLQDIHQLKAQLAGTTAAVPHTLRDCLERVQAAIDNAQRL